MTQAFPRSTVWGLVACGAVLFLAPVRPWAQTGDIVLPPNGVLTNYNRVPIGQQEGLEAGAFVARTHDAAACWYNPAGLVLSKKSALNASANAFELNSVELVGVGRKQSGTRFSSTGTFVGAVLGEPIMTSPDWRLGIAFTTPLSWRPSGLDGAFAVPSAGGTEAFSYATSGALLTSIPSVAAGYRVNDRLRLGASIGVGITNLAQSQSLSDRLTDPAQSETVSRSFVTDGSTTNFLFTAGVQWDVSSSLTLGATITPPGARLGGSSKLVYSLTSFSGEGSRQVGFRDTAARFEYKEPLKAVVGGGLDLGRAQIETDIRYYGEIDEYEMFSSDEIAALLVTDPDGVPADSTLAFAPVTESTRAVVNVAVSGNYPLSDAWKVHLGFFSDLSPVEEAGNSIFRSVDLYGVTTGISVSLEHLSGSLGVIWSGGTTDERRIGPSLGGLTTDTRVEVSTFNLLYALSYKF